MAWSQWCSSTATSTGSFTTSSVWGSWVSGTTSTNCTVTYSAGDIWPVWVGSGNTTQVAYTYTTHVYPPRELTASERRGEMIRRAKQRSAAIKRNAEEQAAKERARALLLSVLTDEQRSELETHDKITVHTRTGRRFCLDAKRRQHNAFELGADGRQIAEYCIVAPSSVPQDDHLTAQVLMLRHEEEEFDRIANRWALTAGGARQFINR